MSNKQEKVPDHFKRKAEEQSKLNPGKEIYIDKAFQANIFWVSPIKDPTRNLMCYQNGVCIWNKESTKQD